MTAARKISKLSAPTEAELTDDQFLFFSQLMYKLSGVNLPQTSKNEALLKNRLSKLVFQYRLSSYQELGKMLKNPDNKMLSDFISALTTNKTHFFREDSHFKWLSQYLRLHFAQNQEFRFWCAAASTGQEPYTAAIVMREVLESKNAAKVKFLATDIDLQVLQKAAEGVYQEKEMDGLPELLRAKYFEKLPGAEARYRAKDEIAKMIRFAPFNLIQESYPFQHKFHVIFCRNVLIYFDPETQKNVIDRMARCLVPGGFLILGHSESGTMSNPLVKPLTGAIYQRNSI
jgi:chemotaxis protein methyltransferase CheR